MCGCINREPSGVGIAGREPVEARVVGPQGGGAQLAPPELFAPAPLAVAVAVAGDDVGERRGGVAALGDHLDRGAHMRHCGLVEPLAIGMSWQGGAEGPRPPKSIVTSSPVPSGPCPFGAAAVSVGVSDGVALFGREAGEQRLGSVGRARLRRVRDGMGHGHHLRVMS